MVRAVCMRCNRPEPVCVCSALPAQKIFLNTKIMVLQHPCELRKQIIGTVPLLALCLINFELLIARGDGMTSETRGKAPLKGDLEASPSPLSSATAPSPSSSATASGPPSSTPSEGDPAEAADREGGERATPNNGVPRRPKHHRKTLQSWRVEAFDRLQRNPSLEEALADPGTLLLYPGPGAEDIETMPPMEDGKPRTLIVVDGTWRQAGRVMRETRVLQQAISAGTVRRVQFAHAGSSGYEFRKEPHDFCLSTLESVAYTLRFLERGADGVAAVEALSATFKLMVKMQTTHIAANKVWVEEVLPDENQDAALGTAEGGGRAGTETWLEEHPVLEQCKVAVRRPYALFRTEMDHRTGRSTHVQDREMFSATYDEAASVCKRVNEHRVRGSRLTVLPLPLPPGASPLPATLVTSACYAERQPTSSETPTPPAGLAKPQDASSSSSQNEDVAKLSQTLREELHL